MRWQHTETQAKQADSFRGCGLAQITILFLLAQGNCKNQVGRLLEKQTPGVQGRARGTEGQRGCWGAKVEVQLSCSGTRDGGRHGSQPLSGSPHGHFQRRHRLPNPSCLMGPWARLANLRPRRAWSLRQSMRGKGQRHPGCTGGCSWGSTPPLPTIAMRRCRAGLPGPPECPQLPNAWHRTRPTWRWPLARPGTGLGLQLYGFYKITL